MVFELESKFLIVLLVQKGSFLLYFWFKKEVSKRTSIRQVFGLVLTGKSRELSLCLSVKQEDSCHFEARK